MPDITMCNGYDCPIKEQCYRYTARPDSYQSFFAESPRKGLTCSQFMQNNNKTPQQEIPDTFGVTKGGVYYDCELDEIYIVDGVDYGLPSSISGDAIPPVRKVTTKDGTYIGYLIDREALSYIGEF